jgi:GxxExxY protein
MKRQSSFAESAIAAGPPPSNHGQKHMARVLHVFERMWPTDDEIDALTEGVIGCAIEVHRTLGPGLLESVYRECVLIELRANQFSVELERSVPIEYKGHRIRTALKVDLLVEGRLVVELKAVEALHSVHQA